MCRTPVEAIAEQKNLEDFRVEPCCQFVEYIPLLLVCLEIVDYTHRKHLQGF